MKNNSTLIRCMALIATVLGLTNGWAILSGTGTRLVSQYERQLQDLEKNLKNALPTASKQAQSEYLKAREAENAALDTLKKAQERLGKYGRAKGLVDHAKGKWIREAVNGIKKAEENLKSAKTDAERKAAEADLARWEKTKKEGLKALEERQAALDEAERDKPKAERAVKEAQEALAQAKSQTINTIGKLGLEKLLQSDALDSSFAKYMFLTEATPRGLAAFADKGNEEQEFLEALLDDTDLLIQISVADGAKNGNYSKALEIYYAIQNQSDKASEGTLQRLALAIALEHATPIKQQNPAADSDAPDLVDPVKRYLHYEKAFLSEELDPAFKNLSVWDMRMVVDGEEPDDILAWGRQMLRNYRPDHITMDDYRWRYVALVRSDIPYGSQDNKYDRDDLHFFQNILKNGGVCGRRAFIGRFVLRAFGIPTTARPQKGHAALVHWTPDGWVACLGGGWGAGWTKTAYHDDRDFLATTQARSTGSHYMRVQRAYWIGKLMGEKHSYGFFEKHEPEFWNGLALYTQRALIQASKAKTLEAVGEDIAEASDTKEKIEIADVEITEQDRKVSVDDEGRITIPAAATSEPSSNSRGIIFTPSTLGGKQLHYSRGAGSAEFEYTFQAPEEGKYALRARVVTPSWQQNLNCIVNRDDEPIKISLPHTVGLWDFTEPVAVELKRGRNTLRFSRYSEGKPKGFSIKDFTLTPWDLHLKQPNKIESATPAETDHGISSSYRRALDSSLMQALADIYTDGNFEPLPMDLTITSSKVKLIEVKDNGAMIFQGLESEKKVPLTLEDLALEDHALLARLVARLRPEDPTAHARVWVYMNALENYTIANAHAQKVGREAIERFTTELEKAAE